MKKLLVISILLLAFSFQWSVVSAQTKPEDTSAALSASLKDYEAFDYAGSIDKDVEQYKKSFDQRILEIKYVLGLVGITSETTLQEASGKDATCLRLDMAIRLLADQRAKITNVKTFKKIEKKEGK